MKKFIILGILCASIIPLHINAQDEKNNGGRPSNATQNNEFNVTAEKVKDNIYVLKGKGGNIGLFIGKDGAFLIDDQFAESTTQILSAVSELTSEPIQFLINTHHHGDHTGANKNMNEEGVVIFAHENVRKRLIMELMRSQQDSLDKAYKRQLNKGVNEGIPSAKAEENAKQTVAAMENDFNVPENILPMVTFDKEMTFYYNDEKIFVFHVHNAHTDGDSMIYFTETNVLHTGDAFVNGRYPFIDVENGGSVDGYIDALSKIQMVANEETKIIPGHGSIANLDDVVYAQSMLKFLSSRVTYYRVEGKSLEQILSMTELTKEFEDKGFGNAFISREEFITVLYQDALRKYPTIKKNKKN
jgi:cyclase